MSWNRQHSNIEELMVKVLKSIKALSLQEIVVFLVKVKMFLLWKNSI